MVRQLEGCVNIALDRLSDQTALDRVRRPKGAGNTLSRSLPGSHVGHQQDVFARHQGRQLIGDPCRRAAVDHDLAGLDRVHPATGTFEAGSQETPAKNLTRVGRNGGVAGHDRSVVPSLPRVTREARHSPLNGRFGVEFHP